MDNVIFLFNENDKDEVEGIKNELENLDIKFSILMYDEERKKGTLELLVKGKELKVEVVFIGKEKIHPEISSFVENTIILRRFHQYWQFLEVLGNFSKYQFSCKPFNM